MKSRVAMVILLACGFLWNCFVMILNRRSLKNSIPDCVKDVYDPCEYTRWKKYTAEKNQLELWQSLCTFASNLMLLVTNAYAGFAGLFPQTDYMQLLSVILISTVVSVLVSIPFEIYDTFVIEQKYGFNRSTKKTFVSDIFKNLIISVVLQSLIVGIFAALHCALGDWVILLFAIAVTFLMLLISLLVPVFTRLFNKFTPLEQGELKEKLIALMTSHGYKVRSIEVMDASRRSSKMNAYFTGFGPMKTIVLYDTLVAATTTEQLCAVFAHEMGHGLHKDTLKNQVFSAIQALLMGVAAWLIARTPEMFTAFGFTGVNYGMVFILMGIVLEVLSPLMGLITSTFSRKMEYRADEQAVKEGYGKPLCEALKILAKGNFADLSPDALLVKLCYSHPPIHARIEAIEKKMAEQK